MRVTIAKGQTLAEALAQNNIILDKPCNGRGTCGGCAVRLDKIGRVKSCQFRLPGTYEVQLEPAIQFHTVMAGNEVLPEETQLLMNSKNELQYEQQIQIAIDLGTTTVALAGYGYGKKCVRSFMNPQRCMGADVMSRIEMANLGHADKLRYLIEEKLFESIEGMAVQLQEMSRLGQSEQTHQMNTLFRCNVVIAANTTMGHLLCGLSCEKLASAPFQPVSLEAQKLHWEFGSTHKIVCDVTLFPGISAFVGGDIVSGLYALHIRNRTEPVLFLDLGTNGEMALWTKTELYVTSTAAGPAFEASELAMAMHAAGVMKVLHTCLQTRVIDENGTLESRYFEKGYPVIGNDGNVIFLTQEDIRQIQMAKAAIRAGIELLLLRAGIQLDELGIIYLAGGMGYYIDPEDAKAIGLLPDTYHGPIEAVGNSSLRGAIRFLGEQQIETQKQLSEKSRGIEKYTHASEIVLANDPKFMDRYIFYMNLPRG